MKRSLTLAGLVLLVTGMVLTDSIAGTALVAAGLGALVVAVVEWGRS